MITIDDLKEAGLFQAGKIDEIYKAAESYDVCRLLVVPLANDFSDEDTKKILNIIYVTSEDSPNKQLGFEKAIPLGKILEELIGFPVVLISYHGIIESAALAGIWGEDGLAQIKRSIAIDALVPWIPLEEQLGNRQAPARQIAETKVQQNSPIHSQFGSGSPFQKPSSPKPTSPSSNNLSVSQIQEAIKQSFDSNMRHQLMDWLLANYPEDLNSFVSGNQVKRKAGPQESV